ncbi:hypothetical protein AALP_AAs56467U000100 [Arabis alpina]|uniref:Uncharacterized protein n=1 Tax=Arabis alpina TaxID=50452 RepID=A0A087FXS5_ARAAL|nr:hypothetical protein AALP_AAs56467U000100 [Arabis alpina]
MQGHLILVDVGETTNIVAVQRTIHKVRSGVTDLRRVSAILRKRERERRETEIENLIQNLDG